MTHNENQEDVRAFDAVLRLCSGGTIVVCSVFYNPATRGWCIYEWDHTILHHGADGLHMPISLEDRVIVVNAINVEQAECFMPADKEMILGLVRRQTALERVAATVGGVQARLCLSLYRSGVPDRDYFAERSNLLL